MNNFELRCPRDDSSLNIDVTEVGTNDCVSCLGVLVDIKNIPSVRNLKHNNLMSLKTSELYCPSCSLKMREFTYKKIVIDICPSCKCVWLDPGEEVIIEKQEHDNKKEDSKWYDQIDLLSIIEIGSSSGDNSTCSTDDGGVLEFVGEAIGSIFDGL
ncbi:MAG: zf-TFIIB domain-containing protein [Saccharospirillaceae bacterium]|nr:zf-TFIIB domain-containing protein [Pseudomonadales bacterium]NRB81273.1 zf-TFIIB domain-containing protein [Saccharospirillaceae bacterium]